MDYKKATIEDLPVIHTLVQDAIASLQAGGNPQWDERYPTDADFIPDIEIGTQYLGLIDGSVGMVFALNTDHDTQYDDGAWRYPDARWIVLHRFIFHPSLWGQGLSRTALSDIIHMLREQGVETVRLDVYRENLPAQKLYRSFGFKPVGVAYFRDKSFDLMELRLEDAISDRKSRSVIEKR